MQESLESIPDKVIAVLHTFGKLISYLEGWETIQQVAGTARHTEQLSLWSLQRLTDEKQRFNHSDFAKRNTHLAVFGEFQNFFPSPRLGLWRNGESI